jgi:hypothetical protein
VQVSPDERKELEKTILNFLDKLAREDQSRRIKRGLALKKLKNK